MRHKLQSFLTTLAGPPREERSGFEFIWMILLLTGAGIVVTLLVRMLFFDVI